MNSQVGQHNEEHLDLVFLYILQAIAAGEVPAVEAQIAACEDCQREVEMLRPLMASFVSWRTDVLRPPVSLWQRLAQRIADETGTESVLAYSQAAAKPEWEEVAPGISVQVLGTDTEQKRVSMLVRMAPGIDYPAHRHEGVEELYLLHGSLIINDKQLFPGDYIRAEAGSVDHRVWSEAGCTCFLLASTDDVILQP